MSLYTDASEAIRRLTADERLHAPDHRGFFTDLDVVALASQIGDGYSKGEMTLAIDEANNTLRKYFNQGRVVRFGPVRLPGVKTPDYARIATRIVHASPDGPGEMSTPNGVFKRIRSTSDRVPHRAGRKGAMVNRDDRQPWGDQIDEEVILRARLAELQS